MAPLFAACANSHRDRHDDTSMRLETPIRDRYVDEPGLVARSRSALVVSRPDERHQPPPVFRTGAIPIIWWPTQDRPAMT